MKITTKIPLSLLALACLQVNAATPTTTTPPSSVTAAGTAYQSYESESYIDLGPAMEPMAMASMLMCIVGASGAPLLPNETYQAVADFGLCGAGGGSTQASYSSITVESSRASAAVAQQAKMWIGFKSGASVPEQHIHFKAQMSAAPTATNHLGAWQLDWEFQNPDGANTWENGHMKAVTSAGGFAEFKMASKSDMPGDTARETYAKIAMTSATVGTARVKTTQGPGNDYAMAFNDTLVTIKDGDDAATCQNLNVFTDTVHEYNLYDSNGALVDISAEIEFTTVTGSQGVLGQYSYYNSDPDGNPGTDDGADATGYWAWIDGDDYPSATGSTTVSDRITPATKYTISWTVGGSGATAYQVVTAVADGTSVAGTAHAFDKPIIFDVSASQLSTTVSPLKDRNDNTDTILGSDFDGSDQLAYNGPGRLWGIGWDNGTFKHKVALADGTALISKTTGNDAAHQNNTYYVKAATVARTPVIISDTATCSALDSSLSAAKLLVLPTATDISNNAPALGTEPTVTAKPKVKDGVLTN